MIEISKCPDCGNEYLHNNFWGAVGKDGGLFKGNTCGKCLKSVGVVKKFNPETISWEDTDKVLFQENTCQNKIP